MCVGGQHLRVKMQNSENSGKQQKRSWKKVSVVILTGRHMLSMTTVGFPIKNPKYSGLNFSFNGIKLEQ